MVTRAGKRLAGAAFERFGESVHDIRAAIALAVKSGYRRVILAGHSTGANKVLHYLARTRDRRVVGLILLGPVSDVAGERKRIGSPRACPEGLGHEVRRRSELCADVRAAESHRTRPPRPAGWRGSLAGHPGASAASRRGGRELKPKAAIPSDSPRPWTRDRFYTIHLALQALRARVEPDRVLACELAWEVHCHGYWSQVRRPDGTAYDCEETYFRDVLGLASWRTAYKRLAIGRMLVSFKEPERLVLRAAIAEVGLAKAAVVAPAIERFREWKTWLQLALQCSMAALQARLSEALEALPRGREPSPPGERFRRDVLAAMPDIEAMELVERFFAIGAKVVGSPHPVAIFLAGCRESLPEWDSSS